ncbi:MAG: glycosyltransferase family 39 protein [Chloroflexi bacterium]|nr:glycosyltransferase family 39 protein [Chloroflexota bacterium]
MLSSITGLVVFGLGSSTIRSPDLGLDGGLSLALALIPLNETLDFLAHDVHPPLYYVILRGWIALVGTRPLAVKFLSLALATLAVVTFVSWQRPLHGQARAIAGALLLAASPLTLADAATVRDLAAGVWLMILNCWAYDAAWCRRQGRRWSVAYLISGTLAVWTSFLAVGALCGQALHAALSVRTAPRTTAGPTPSRATDTSPGSAFLAIGAVGATILPWIAFAVQHGWLTTLISGGPAGDGAARPISIGDLSAALTLLVAGSSAVPPAALLAIVIVATLLLWPGPFWQHPHRSYSNAEAADPLHARPNAAQSATFAAVGLASTLVFALALGVGWLRQGVPSRYLAVALPFWAAVMLSLTRRVSLRRSAAAVGLLVLMNLVSLVAWLRLPPLPRTFWDPRGMQSFLDAHVRPSDRIVFLTLEQAGYYAALSPRPGSWVAIPVGTTYLEGNAAANAQRMLAPLLGSSDVLWLVAYHGILGTGQRAVEAWLSARTYPIPPISLTDSDVHPYLTGRSLGPDRPVGALFANDVQLVAASLPTTAHPGDGIALQLVWHADHPLSRDLTVFVHLLDPQGQIAAQSDGRPAAGLLPTTRWHGEIIDRHGLFIPDNAVPGAWWIEVGLYDDTGRLAVIGRSDGAVRLGPLRVEAHDPPQPRLAEAEAEP